MAIRFELATRRVTSPDSEIFTPFELQVNFTQKMLALPYQSIHFLKGNLMRNSNMALKMR